MFKGKEAFSKQSFKLSDKALKVKEQCAELVEMYVEAAKPILGTIWAKFSWRIGFTPEILGRC